MMHSPINIRFTVYVLLYLFIFVCKFESLFVMAILADVFLNLKGQAGKLSQIYAPQLNILLVQKGKHYPALPLCFLKFSAFSRTGLFFHHVCLKSLYRRQRLPEMYF